MKLIRLLLGVISMTGGMNMAAFCLGYFLASPVAIDEVTFHPDLISYM